MVKTEFWRITEKKARKGNYETPKPINNYKNKNKKDVYHISKRIPKSSVGKKVLVFDNVNEFLFHVTPEKVGFKFNDFDSKGKFIQKKDKKVENKKTKKRSNPITDEFVERLTRGMIDQDSKIRASFLGKTVKFKNNGVITDCFVTLDKIGRTFGDFTYTSENEVMKKMPILSNTSNEKRPKYNNLTPEKKKRQATKPIKEKKPRKKKKPGKKKEPWEYEGKSFLDKYNEGK